MKTLAVLMMIILAINVSNAADPASSFNGEATIGMLEGPANVTSTQCSARFGGDPGKADSDPVVNIEPASSLNQ